MPYAYTIGHTMPELTANEQEVEAFTQQQLLALQTQQRRDGCPACGWVALAVRKVKKPTYCCKNVACLQEFDEPRQLIYYLQAKRTDPAEAAESHRRFLLSVIRERMTRLALRAFWEQRRAAP